MKITILTEKVNVIGFSYFIDVVKEFLYRVKVDGLVHIKRQILKIFQNKKFTGHFAVTRSLCEGLKKSGLKFNYNPLFSFSIHKHVIVLSGIEVLEMAIALKKKGKVKTILAGPNLMVRSNEFNNILANPLINKVIVPSEWIKTAYIEDLPEIKNKIEVWPAGTDSDFFKPNSFVKQKEKVLIYWKSGHDHLLTETLLVLKEHGLISEVLNYGSYTVNTYKQLLSECAVVIFYSKSESQGLALQEAWTMNVPTFVWQSDELTIKDKVFTSFSSAPYLNHKTGRSFKSISELEQLIVNYKQGTFNFEPRNYILKHLTDEVCAQQIIKLFEKEI